MKRITTFFVLILVATATAAFTFTALDKEGDGYKIGDYATDFSLKNVDGKMVSLSNYPDAKGYIVVFTCNHCPYAKMYEDRIIDLANKYTPLGYPLIAINPNNPEVQPQDSFENMVKRARIREYSFPYVIDAKQDIYPQYGAKATPHVFVLQKTDKGNQVKYMGAIDDNYRDVDGVETKFVENAINSLMEGREVEVTTTKAIGCSIKV